LNNNFQILRDAANKIKHFRDQLQNQKDDEKIINAVKVKNNY